MMDADAPHTTAEAVQDPPKLYLILYGVSKKHNIGQILRSATAFNVTAVCLVGSRKFNSFGAHGSELYVPMLHFDTLEMCCETLKKELGVVDILGIEIDDSAMPVHRHPFRGNTALMMGEEGHGMNDKQMNLCDRLVYISQYGSGTASLNVCVATSIVLHSFAVWAGFPERARNDQKYVVGERPRRNAPRGQVPYTEKELEALRKERALKRAEKGAESE
mmetsp:Transcript_14928/g.42506  ORF Transcript_14928/g.42506 Transcript_14928/m.42506 type:complete len:219 (-) Transcript_14928:793-1449(-)